MEICGVEASRGFEDAVGMLSVRMDMSRDSRVSDGSCGRVADSCGYGDVVGCLH